jgi:hypothetical protein
MLLIELVFVGFILTYCFQCGRCATTKKDCFRLVDQDYGSRCRACASSRRQCSLVTEVKAIKQSPSKTLLSLDDEIPTASTSKKQKGKSVLSALAKTFKRKTEDRSPEVAQPSKKPSFRQLSPTLSTMQAPGSEAGAPPLTKTPSYISLDSFESEPGTNFEADHLRMLLNASQEDLRLERTRADERVQRQAEMFAKERQHYAARIRELERKTGEGSSSRK